MLKEWEFGRDNRNKADCKALLKARREELEQQLAALRAAADAHTAARIARDGVVPAMQACREHCDALERMLNAAAWPLPSYAEMLWLH